MVVDLAEGNVYVKLKRKYHSQHDKNIPNLHECTSCLEDFRNIFDTDSKWQQLIIMSIKLNQITKIGLKYKLKIYKGSNLK